MVPNRSDRVMLAIFVGTLLWMATMITVAVTL